MLTRRTILAAAPALALALAACTTAQQQAALSIAASALPCYNAVAASITTGSNATKALTAADVLVSSPACAAVDANSLTLIASALNTGTPVIAAPASTVAAVRAPKG
jgi:hypothetical protein